MHRHRVRPSRPVVFVGLCSVLAAEVSPRRDESSADFSPRKIQDETANARNNNPPPPATEIAAKELAHDQSISASQQEALDREHRRLNRYIAESNKGASDAAFRLAKPYAGHPC